MPIFLAFLLVPLIEIGLFIQVGGWIGLWPTLLIVVLTAIVGTYMVRAQGQATLSQLRTAFSELRDPSEPLVHGAMILFAGALLLTPGFFTDACGLLLLVPTFRARAYKSLRKRVKVTSFSTGAPQRPAGQPDVIDGEFEELDPDQRPTHPPSGNPSGWTRH